MSKALVYAALVLSFIALVLVRVFEQELFYDPLLSFFKANHQGKPLPDLQAGRLLLHTAARYLINSGLSLAVLWLLFKNSNIVRLSLVVFAAFLLLALPAYGLLVEFDASAHHFALFYLRRFLIQPLLLLVLIPAIYFHRKRR